MWVRWSFSVACLAVAGYYAASLIIHSIIHSGAPRDGAGGQWGVGRERGYELSHLAMALGMAAMFSPLGDPASPLVWLIVFGMAAVWFAACLLRAGGSADDRASASADSAAHHHLVANLAMLFMVVGGHHHGTGGAGAGGAAGGFVGPGHEGHTAGVVGGWIEGPLGTVLTVVLAGYFAVHTVRSLRVLLSSPRTASDAGAAGTGPVTVLVARGAATQSQVQAGCHVVMGTAMTVMFGLML